MSDNNSFLSNYGKSMEPAEEVVVRDAGVGYKYEEKSGFKKPVLGGGYIPPRTGFRRYLIPAIAAAAVVLGLVLTLILLLGGGAKVPDMTGWTLGDANLWASQNNVMLKTVQQYNDTVDEGKIISQDIEAGGEIKKGAFLTLTVSQGHDLSVTLPVPDFTSMTMEQVQAWAAQNFMTKVRITSEFSDTVPSGKVIRYEITDNTVVDKIRRDTAVYVIISKGPEDPSSILVEVPDFKTMSVSEAYIFANDNGLVLTITEQYDDYVPKNSIISASVKAKEKISKGSEIKLVVSKGKMIEMPDFSDYTKEEAQSVAASLGIPAAMITTIEKYSSSGAGRLISQSISAGTIYEDGDYLELTYSLGNKINLGDYVGKTRDAIESWANELNKQGAKITFSWPETNSSSPKGTILYQSPSNTMISYRTKITVTLSKGKIIYVPDFVDHHPNTYRGYDTAITREEAIKMCEDAGLIPAFEKATDFEPKEVLPGEIVDQKPAAGTEKPAGSKVTLTYIPIDMDKADNICEVPEFSKLKMAKAVIDKPENGYHMKLTIVYEGEGTVVIAQSIAEKSKVPKGSVIVLTLGDP